MSASDSLSPPVFLSLSDRDDAVDRAFGRGFVDGGWWPRSLDLAAELPPLLTELFAVGFDVVHVYYNEAAWSPAPAQLSVSGRRVSLSVDVTQDAASVRLVECSGLKPVLLVVVPPQTDAEVAENALVLAGHDGDLHRPDQILARARQQTEAGDNRG